MREILFRGKQADSGKWVYGFISGLTDKNGTKIFEGDIIHGKLGNFAVRWSEYIGAFVAGISTKIMPCLNRGTMKCYEVVGNIHDNPELLGSNIHKAETAESE